MILCSSDSHIHAQESREEEGDELGPSGGQRFLEGGHHLCEDGDNENEGSDGGLQRFRMGDHGGLGFPLTLIKGGRWAMCPASLGVRGSTRALLSFGGGRAGAESRGERDTGASRKEQARRRRAMELAAADGESGGGAGRVDFHDWR